MNIYVWRKTDIKIYNFCKEKKKSDITSSGNITPLAFFIASALCFINDIFKTILTTQFIKITKYKLVKIWEKKLTCLHPHNNL